MENRKGIDILIKAVMELKRHTVDFEVNIAAPFSPLFNEYFKLYEECNLFLNLRLIHQLDEKQIDQLLSQADLFVMPSKDYETFGLTVIEAMSRGIPVISSGAGALSEVVGGFDKRFVVKDLTSKKLAQKIYWYLKLSEDKKANFKILAKTYIEKKIIGNIIKINC